MKILFRTDSSSSIGIGHVMRDLVLAKQLEDDEIHFATLELDGNINHKIPYPLHKLSSNKPDELIRLIKSLQIELLIVDHYGIGYEFEKEIKTEIPSLKLMVFDDTYEKHFCDILLNHNISAKKERYKNLVPKHCELRCGVLFTLIRNEFREEKKIYRDKIYDIFIAMGGTDASNINISILKSLPANLKICIVTTTMNARLDELKEFTAPHPNLSLHVDSDEISKLLNQSKFAIITPSVMVHEVLCMEVPFLAIKVADNQNDMYEYLVKEGYFVLEKFDENRLKEALKTLKVGS